VREESSKPLVESVSEDGEDSKNPEQHKQWHSWVLVAFSFEH
jgi:hypothetical protein